MSDRTIKVFLAAASDSNDLVKIAREEIENINQQLSIKRHLSIKADYWKFVPAGMGNPEKRILDEMKLKEYDIFIEVFRFSYGNPTGNTNKKGIPYKSGMEEEFYTAYDCWESNNKNISDIVILKSEEPIPRNSLANMENYNDMVAFFKEFSGTGKHPGLYNTFGSIDEFREVFRRNLMSRVFDALVDVTRLSEEKQGWKTCSENGVSQIFFANDNNSRNEAKSVAICNSREICLRARSGFSYITNLGPFYFDIINALNNLCIVKILLQNPFSITAFFGSLTFHETALRKTYNEFRKNNIDAEKLISEYLNSHWYLERFVPTINNYIELKKRYKKLLQLRLSESDCSDSILITDEVVFFKPILNASDTGRRKPHIFEIEVGRNSDLFSISKNEFDSTWNKGISYKVYNANMEQYKIRLIDYFRNDPSRNPSSSATGSEEPPSP